VALAGIARQLRWKRDRSPTLETAREREQIAALIKAAETIAHAQDRPAVGAPSPVTEIRRCPVCGQHVAFGDVGRWCRAYRPHRIDGAACSGSRRTDDELFYGFHAESHEQYCAWLELEFGPAPLAGGLG
jgi:hypothetical protein